MSKKNILLLLVDQLQFPRFSYGPDYGFAQPIKLITGFQEPKKSETLDPDWAKNFFPGLWSLRHHSVVLRQHRIASSACIPSRAVMMTGQYSTRTGVTVTDGTFKNGDSPMFPWLSPDGIPTIGTWMREAGYSTHYFGKWHVSNPPEHNLLHYGFDNWELSYPEPHGSEINNLGIYRDYQFADLASAFIRRRGLGLPFSRFVAETNYNNPLAVNAYHALSSGNQTDDKEKPWFAVASFTNPHDIAAYPALPRQIVDHSHFSKKNKLDYLRSPVGVPDKTWRSNKPAHGTMQFDLNPLGFPQGSAAANSPPTLSEDLSNKPRCQYDYSYKMGLTLASKLGWSIAWHRDKGKKKLPELWKDAALAMNLSGLPFQIQKDPEAWASAFIRFYAYLVQTVDQHIAQVLHALRESGQAENTIVLFMSDHGEYGGAHGMLMEKWHTAYEEAIHVPVVIQSSSINADPDMKQCDALTSHIDLLPTLIGLAGVDMKQRAKIREKLRIRSEVPEPVGVDLTSLINDVGGRMTKEPIKNEAVLEADGTTRRGVLFITDDDITAPLANMVGDPHSFKNNNEYEAYKIAVKELAEKQIKKRQRPIFHGSVIQPNHLRCVVTQDHKLARYWDPSGKEADEWEMYDLTHDPNEIDNLLAFDQPFPTAAKRLPAWAGGPIEVERQARDLRSLLIALETRML